MTVRTISLSDISDEDVEKWRDLAARAVTPNPMSEPECVLPAAKYLRNGRRITILVVERQGRFDACIPLQKVRRWRSIPHPAWSTRVRRMTWDATPLVDGDRGESAIRDVFVELSARTKQGEPGLLVLEWLNERGPIGEYARAAAREMSIPWRTYAQWEQPFLAHDAADGPSMHSKKTLANRERKLRALGRVAGGEPEIVDHGSNPSKVAAYIDLESSGYKAASGVAMSTKPGEAEWFHEMAESFAHLKRFHILTLEVGSTTVAMECLIRAGEGFSMVKWSYDERFEKYSPGAQLHLSTHSWFRDQIDAAWLDVCTYEGNKFALGEYPETRSVSTTVFGLRGRSDKRWLNMLRYDRVLRACVFKLGERLGLNTATLTELSEGGGYGQLDWHRAKGVDSH